MSISASFTAHRTSGVAPLIVHFDASATTSSVTSLPFHELDYSWNFGDPKGEIWENGASGQNKNVEYGPIAGHVYDDPGTYLVQLKVINSANEIAFVTETITVVAWDDATHGETVCVSNSSSTTDDVPGSVHLTTSDFDTAINGSTGNEANHGAAFKRILFKRGDTFTASAIASINSTGPGIVGSYGPSASLPIVEMAHIDEIFIFRQSGAAAPSGFVDWRLMDLEIDGNDIQSDPEDADEVGISVGGGVTNILVYRMNIHNTGGSCITVAHQEVTDGSNSIWHQYPAIVECIMTDTVSESAVYMGAEGTMFLGNFIDNTGSHGARFAMTARGIIAHNFVGDVGSAMSNFKIVGPSFGDSDPIEAGRYTEKVVVADNHLETNDNGIMVELSPQSGGAVDERLRNIVFERNLLIFGTGTNAGIRISAVDVTLRNNITNSTLGTSSSQTWLVNKLGSEPDPDQIRIYNNTYYSGSTDDNFRAIDIGVDVASSGAGIQVKNNMGWAPNFTAVETMLRQGAGINVDDSNNASDAQVDQASSPFVSGTPSTPADFRLVAGYPISSGATLPVFRDFFGNRRPLTSIDMGAIEDSPAVTTSFIPSRGRITSETDIHPLYVFFDATATTGTPVTPFMDLHYSWSFGKGGGAGTWTNGSISGKSKDVAYGPVAATVFESPGTYTVSLTVTDPISGTTDRHEEVIFVDDAEAYFDESTAAKSTLCVSTGTNFDDIPSGADTLQSSDFDSAINSNIANYRRILFKRGDTFTSSTAADIDLQGPGIIGQWGVSGAKPLVTGTHSHNVFTIGIDSNPDLKDWRIMDLQVDWTGGADNSIFVKNFLTDGSSPSNGGGFDQLLVFRIDALQVAMLVSIASTSQDNHNSDDGTGANPHRHHDQVGIVECTVTEPNDNACFYGEAKQLAFLGNNFGLALSGTLAHTIRIVHANGLVLSNNTLGPCTGFNSIIKLHAAPWTDLIGTFASGSATINNVENSLGNAINGTDHGAMYFEPDARIQSGTYRTGGTNGDPSTLVMSKTATATGTFSFVINGVSSRDSQYTQDVVISDNHFLGHTNATGAGGSNGSYWLAVAPQSESFTSRHDERIRRVIVERNFFTCPSGDGEGGVTGIILQADNCVARNNIIDAQNTGFIDVIRVGLNSGGTQYMSPENDNIKVYNNTAYGDATVDEFNLMIKNVGVTSSGDSWYNNVGYCPGGGDNDDIAGTDQPVGASGTNSSTSQISNTNPFIASVPSPISVPTDFKLSTGSYAKNSGTAVPVYDDFFNIQRSTIDMGAAEFQDPPSAPVPSRTMSLR